MVQHRKAFSDKWEAFDHNFAQNIQLIYNCVTADPKLLRAELVFFKFVFIWSH